METAIISNKKESYLIILSSLYVTIILVTLVLLFKIIQVSWFVGAAASLVMPLCFIIADIITELYGYKTCRVVIYTAIACDFLFIAITFFLIKLPSPSYWHHQESYNFIIGGLPKTFIGLLLATTVGFLLNAKILAKWKKALKGKRFLMRSVISSIVGEVVFTIICLAIDLYGLLTVQELIKAILFSCIIKFLALILLSTPSAVIVNFLKGKLGDEYLEYSCSKNPFRFWE